MPAVFVVFPPSAGGNHLKNIIVSCYNNDNNEVASIYKPTRRTVHAHIGRNLQPQQVAAAVTHQDQLHILHGHFGEIMSYREEIKNIIDKKFVIISPETAQDRHLLNSRRKGLLYSALDDDDYFDYEQIFLYECFMYHWYLQIPLERIMNISVTEMFSKDLNPALDRLEFLLNITADRNKIHQMHDLWLIANKKWAL